MNHMKYLSLLLLTIFVSVKLTVAQQAPNKPYPLTINGVPFFLSSKKAIVTAFGAPVKVFNPHYECGFHADEQGQSYYSMVYKSLNFIGNEQEGYLMENVLISPETKYVIVFKNKKLTAQTTLEEFSRLSGIQTMETSTGGQNPEDLIKFLGNPRVITTTIELQEKQADDKYIFYFSKGKLCKIEYWSPC